MRNKKTVQIGDRQVEVVELRPKDIRQIFSLGEEIEDMDLDTIIQTVLPLVCDLPPEEFDEMGLSSVLAIWDAAREINTAFFDLARRAGLTEMANQFLDDMKSWIAQGLTDVSADLSASDTPTPPNTDGSSS